MLHLNQKQFKEKYKIFGLMFPKLEEKARMKQFVYFIQDEEGKEAFKKENPEFVPFKITKSQRKILRRK